LTELRNLFKLNKTGEIMKTLWIILMSLALAAPEAAFAGPDKETADAHTPAISAQQGARVIFYGNMTGIEPVMDAFSRKSHIKGIHTRVSVLNSSSPCWLGLGRGRSRRI
jgi:hypothetical protein